MIDTSYSNLYQYIEKPKQSLLIVADQADNLQFLQQVFSENFLVYGLTDHATVVDQCRQHQPDLVLLDVDSSDMNGYDVCRQLKADVSTDFIPVIFIMSSLSSDDEIRGLDAGAVDFVTKPLNLRALQAKVKTHITMKRQTELLKRMAFIDGMTGLYNRRFFDDRMKSEFQRSQRSGSFLSLLSIDVDDFKRFNDIYGYQAGDDSLRRIANCLKRCCKRPADFVARYDGGKFVCLLPDTPVISAFPFAQNLEKQVRELAIQHSESSNGNRMTISLGLAGKNSSVENSLALIELASAALTRAKQEGRGRVWCTLD